MARSPAIILLLALAAIATWAQQKYAGAPPPKKNVPYIVHADSLIPTEALKATEQTKKDQSTYTIPGDKSAARTPLASPLFVIDVDGLDANALKLFRLDVRNGHREVTFHKNGKGGAMPLTTDVSKVSGTLYQIRVVDSLDRGEYSLSPDGSNDVFCFEVF